jgi:hypothetical protein
MPNPRTFQSTYRGVVFMRACPSSQLHMAGQISLSGWLVRYSRRIFFVSSWEASSLTTKRGARNQGLPKHSLTVRKLLKQSLKLNESRDWGAKGTCSGEVTLTCGSFKYYLGCENQRVALLKSTFVRQVL